MMIYNHSRTDKDHKNAQVCVFLQTEWTLVDTQMYTDVA